MTLIEGRKNIENWQTVEFPVNLSDILNNAGAYKYTAGFVACHYDLEKGWIYGGWHRTVEDAHKHFETLKEMCERIDPQWWIRITNMTICMHNGTYFNNPSMKRWCPIAMVVEE